jgi:putative DNA primase/helicase
MNIDKTTTEFGNIPSELHDFEHWVCWRYQARADGKPAKVPIVPLSGVVGEAANVSRPESWKDYFTAWMYIVWADHPKTRQYVPTDIEGLGFVFSENDPYAGIDLDDCVDENGEIADWAARIIEQVDSYTEFSPSGTGIHILVEGELPSGGVRNGQIEMYDSARYFTITGAHVSGTPTTIGARQKEIDAIHTDVTEDQRPKQQPEPRLSQGCGRGGRTHEDEWLLDKAMGAGNGDKFERLWDGSTAGYPSHSEADQALCCQLAFWTAGDRNQMDRLFRRSGLMRSKWDDRHSSEGQTYGELTIDSAHRLVDNYYKY